MTVNTWGAITWFFTRHVGVGVGLSGSDIAYEQKTDDRRIKVDIRQSTLNFNLSFVF